MVDASPDVRPPSELVNWTIACQVVMCAAAGFLLGGAIRSFRYQHRWSEDMVFVLGLMLLPIGIVFVLYRSVFRRVRMPGSRGRLWMLPTLYGLIMVLSCLALPHSIPFMVFVSVIFAMLYRIVWLDQKWQGYLVENDIPPRTGFSLWDLMMGFVGLSIALAIARLVVVTWA